MSVGETFLLILFMIGITSAATFGLMYFDKRAAEQGAWRVPERRILMWAYLGGGLGALAAQKRFRHKTRKEPFRTLLMGSLFVNALSVFVLLVPTLRQGAFEALKAALQVLG